MTGRSTKAHGQVKLDFTIYDVTDISSLAPYFGRNVSRCGIYVLHFVDRSAYVGQTVDVVNRFSKHSRDWSAKLPDVAIEKVEFATCDPARLDEAEQLLIADLEQTVVLHNKRLTNWPGGRGDIEVRRQESSPIRIPADRAHRSRLKEVPSNSKLRRYLEFAAAPQTSQLSEFVGRYLAEAVPSPEETAGTMWTCTALPTTGNNSRLLTLNVGGLEVLYSMLVGPSPDTAHTWAFVNIAVPDDRSRRELEFDSPVCNAAVVTYRSETAWRWAFDLETFFDPEDSKLQTIFDGHLRHNDEFFDLAYALNKRLMAKQPSMWIPSHNPHLATELLAAAFGADSDPAAQQ
ncbi:GIY-YIG nuclease family protein [Dietzia sp. B44]|uniref:GIY-YIG nuclease family protein n=1 Tax=Dietzia sp. B44 TaxID=1630633 RepID=UPI0015FCDBA5|nr:GIY-YIG nuclease family protein [Dietzia sp. B44]MBB1054731.1 GIY-YIG nuclease family protein [Dietzia sp. B44]